MLGASGHPQKVVGFTEHLQHLIADVQAKQPATLHEEPHLVFAVGVLAEKLATQGLAVGMPQKAVQQLDGQRVMASTREVPSPAPGDVPKERLTEQLGPLAGKPDHLFEEPRHGAVSYTLQHTPPMATRSTYRYVCARGRTE